MKCPYCAEVIQDEAIKCKHCGEWLNKKNIIDREAIKEAIVEGTKDVGNILKNLKKNLFGSTELIIPTDSEPFMVKGLTLYKDHFKYNNQDYYYNEIVSLMFNIYSYSMNFANIHRRCVLRIYTKLNDEDNFPLETGGRMVIDIYLSSFHSKGNIKQINEQINK